MEETGLKFPKQGTSGGASPSGSGWAPPAVAETAAPNLQRGRGELQRGVGVHARVHADTPAPTISPVLLVHPCPEPASDPQTYAEAPRLCPITAVVRTGGARLCPARWGAPPPGPNATQRCAPQPSWTRLPPPLNGSRGCPGAPHSCGHGDGSGSILQPPVGKASLQKKRRK